MNLVGNHTAVILLCFVVINSTQAFLPTQARYSIGTRQCTHVMWSTTSSDAYIDPGRRSLLNLIVLGVGTVSAGAIALPYFAFFMPPEESGDGGGITAKDANGIEVIATDYLASKPAGDRSLVQGLKGDAA